MSVGKNLNFTGLGILFNPNGFTFLSEVLKTFRPGVVAHTCNLSILEAEVGGSLEARSSRPT